MSSAGHKGPVGQRRQELCLDARPALEGKQIADLCDDRTGNQDAPARQMQCGEQIDARTVMRVVLDGGAHQGTRFADDHRLAAEALSQQVVNAVGRVRTTCRDRAKPRWRSRQRLGGDRQPLHLDKSSRHLILGQLLDQAVQLVACGGHNHHDMSRQQETP